MRHPRRRQITAVGAATLLLLTACGSADENLDGAPAEESAPAAGPTETDDAAATSSPQEPSDDADSADFSTDPQESEGFPGEFTRGDGPNHLVDVRSGVHEGYDRVVFEFAGEGVPSWRGEYTDAAAELGRGGAIELAGAHILEINVNGPSWPLGEDPEDGLPTQEYYERDRGGAFEEIFIQGPFEAHSQYLIGLEEERPFQMQLLEEPTRLVVDITSAD